MKKLFTLTAVMAVISYFGHSQEQPEIIQFGTPAVNSSPTLPSRAINDNGIMYTEVSYSFPGITINSIQRPEGDFQFISIEGYSKLDETGKPALPSHNDLVAVPLGATVSVRVIQSSFEDRAGYMIHPALEPARDTYGAPEPAFTLDEGLYATNAFYPENVVEVLDIQTFKGCPLAVIRTTPVQFNPVTGVIRVYTQLVYRIEFEGGTRFGGEENTPQGNSLLKNVALNPAGIPAGQQADPANRTGAKNYIIIAPTAYQAAADSLANWKRRLGYSVEVVTQTTWTSTQVKDAIHTRYQSWTPKPDYFVIIGDHGGTYAVPGEIRYTFANPQEPFATDLYYACMDGSTDYFPDMGHGRISVSSASEALMVVLKNINYERNPVSSSSFYSNGLNCAQFQDDDHNTYADRRFTHTSEDIRDYLVDKGYTVNRVYFTESINNPLYYNNGGYSPPNTPIPDELKKPGFAWNGSSSDITNNINSGKFYVFHRDHGYVGGSGWHLPYYTVNNIPSLSNGDLLPVVFSINCHTGEYQIGVCFAEKFIRHTNGGAVGVVAAAYYSYSGYNDGLSCGMVDAIWSDPGLIPEFGSYGTSYPNPTPHEDIYAMGDVVNQGLLRMTQTYSANATYSRYQYELFHYFGDPTLKIWTVSPVSITANIPTECDGTSIAITGSSCPDALATAFCNNELIGSATLAGGNGILQFGPLENGSEIKITLSKHNFRPLMASTLVVTGPAEPPVANFTATPTTLTEGQSAQFNDLSTNTPTSWSWTFPGGTPASSTDRNPVVSYSDAGVYDVTLAVANSAGNGTETKIGYITVNIPPPVADFQANNTRILQGSTVYFTDLSQNQVDIWQWSFPGSTSTMRTDQNPAVVYESIGTFDVSLMVTNTTGSDTETKTGYIEVTDDLYCSAGGNALDEWIALVDINGHAYASGSSGYSKFTNVSFNLEAGNTYPVTLDPGFSSRSKFEYWKVYADFNNDWDFEDTGEELFASSKSKSTVYGSITIPADYDGTTRLRVVMSRSALIAPCGTLDYGEVEDYTLVVGEPVPMPPVADFSTSSTSILVGESVTFTDLSTNNPTSWLWTFEGLDPPTSTDQNPTVTYPAEGTFDVSLNVVNGQGNDTELKIDYITVSAAPPPPTGYCTPSSIDNTADYIDMISIDGLPSNTGQGGSGYVSYQSPVFNLSPGQDAAVTLTPNTTNSRLFWRIWIDFNHDFDFDDSDETILVANNKKGEYSSTISIPGYVSGASVMRISMKNGSSQASCDDGFSGEVEDYHVIFGGESVLPGTDAYKLEMKITPNPASESVLVSFNHNDRPVSIMVQNLLGDIMTRAELNTSSFRIDLGHYPAGIYIIRASDDSSIVVSKFIRK